MDYNEIEFLNKNINIKTLNDYRIKVGKQTQKTIKHLEFIDMKKKVERTQLKKIMENGGLLEHEKSKWLFDFWGKKTYWD
jgi:D-alanyl-D-alanine dipeptidase